MDLQPPPPDFCECGVNLSHATVYPIRCSCGRVYEGPSKGLGDTVAKIIHTATLGKVKPCGGCERRREALNRLVPYSDSH